MGVGWVGFDCVELFVNVGFVFYFYFIILGSCRILGVVCWCG